jgi:hypothetical protein
LRTAARRAASALALAFVKLVEGAHGGGVEFFGVGEDALFGFEGFVFAGLRDWACSISLL